MRLNPVFLLLLLGSWAVSCTFGPGSTETQFEVLLTGVERSDAAGGVTAVPFEGPSKENRARGLTTARFSDNGISVEVEFLSSQIVFAVRNDDKRPITILWDRVTYLDQDGSEHRGFSAGLERGTSLIQPGQRRVVAGAPTDFTSPMDRGLALTGILHPPPSIDPLAQPDRSRYCEQIGKTLEFWLPIEVGERGWEYSLRFAIEDILVVEHRGSRPLRAQQWAGCAPEK